MLANSPMWNIAPVLGWRTWWQFGIQYLLLFLNNIPTPLGLSLLVLTFYLVPAIISKLKLLSNTYLMNIVASAAKSSSFWHTTKFTVYEMYQKFRLLWTMLNILLWWNLLIILPLKYLKWLIKPSPEGATFVSTWLAIFYGCCNWKYTYFEQSEMSLFPYISSD